MSRTRAHIAGVGETRYTRWGKIGDVTEHALALQAIQRAVADAGLSLDDVDGLASFADDRNEGVFLAAELGLPRLRFSNMVWMPGGGGGCAAVANAAMAVETGQAEVVVVYRSLCQGQFFRFGTGGAAADPPPPPRPPTVQPANTPMLASMGFAIPYAMIMAAAAYALPTRRHMHLYGTTKEFLIRFGLNDLSDLPKIEDMAQQLGFEPPPILMERPVAEEMLPLEEGDWDTGDPDTGDPAA